MEMNEIEQFVKSKLPKSFIEKHVEAVVMEAKRLCLFYPEADSQVVEAAAWLHDIGHKFSNTYNETERKEPHNLRSGKIAKSFLVSIDFPSEKIEKVVHCIESHSSSQKPNPATIEARIIFSADKLAHLVEFDFFSNWLGPKRAHAKLKKNLESGLMLPEALEKAKKLYAKVN